MVLPIIPSIITIVSITILAWLELSPWCQKKDANSIRRWGHFVSSILFISTALILFPAGSIIIGILFTIAVAIARLIPVLHHPWDVHRKSYGILLFPLGMMLPLLFITQAHQYEYITGMIILGIADPAANYIGKKYGKHPYFVFKNKKSLEGSLAFFIVTISILILFSMFISPLPLLFIAATAVILTIAEAVFIFGFDNLLLPLITVLALVFFG